MLYLGTLIVLYIMMVLSMLLNILGIYCLHKQKGGNIKQRLLLGNLSLIEIVKMVYDFIPLTTYFCFEKWYNLHHMYFDTIEISMTTIILASIILISADRVMCILLHVKYDYYITMRLIKRTLVISWVISLACGPVMYVFTSKDEYMKIYYYMTLEIIVLIFGVITYVYIGKIVLEINSRVSSMADNSGGFRKLRKMFLTPSLILGSFILFNVIPDLITIFHFSDISYNVTICLWVLNFNIDPIIYIFANKKSRSIALALFRDVSRKHISRVTYSVTSQLISLRIHQTEEDTSTPE